MKSKIKNGYYSDQYFNRTKQILLKDKYHPQVVMQVFQKNNSTVLCGVNEVVNILKQSLGENFKKLKISTLPEGSIISSYETVMLIEGDYSLFAHLETVYLGILARGTKIATNSFHCMYAAYPKPVLFFPARFDRYENQERDGYAYQIARKAMFKHNWNEEYKKGGVSTDAQGKLILERGLGTIPHGLIAAYNGDTALATLKFAKYMSPSINRIALVDFKNDCVNTSVNVAYEMYRKYKTYKSKKYILSGVRLDTSGNMVDQSIHMGVPIKNPCGVTEQLVIKVRKHLDRIGGQLGDEEYFKNIKIIVSGGFTPEKISQFERKGIPVDAYGVGSSMFSGNFDFTADIVKPVSKVGRQYISNSKLEVIK